MEFKDKLQALCRSRNWDRYALQGVVGDVSRSTLDNWWHGKTRPGLTAAWRIAREFDVPLEYLADDGMDAAPVVEEQPEDERRVLDHYRRLKVLGIVADAEEANHRMSQGPEVPRRPAPARPRSGSGGGEPAAGERPATPPARQGGKDARGDRDTG